MVAKSQRCPKFGFPSIWELYPLTKTQYPTKFHHKNHVWDYFTSNPLLVTSQILTIHTCIHICKSKSKTREENGLILLMNRRKED